MELLLTQITNYLLAQSWQIAVLTIAVAVISFLLRNRSAHIRYILWLILLAKCLVPPFYTIPVAVLPEQKSTVYNPAPTITESMISEYSEPEIAVTESPMLFLDQAETIPSSAVAQKQNKYDTRALLAIGWLMGVLALSMYYLVNALRTQIWIHNRRKELPSEYRKNIESLFIAHGIKRIPHIWVLDKISQPFVWGLVRGSIYLPAEMTSKKNASFYTSLLGHELSHVIRFDALINSLQVIAQAIFWFHPFVWWTNRKIRIEREKCCDEMTISSLNTIPEDYSEAIVEILAAKYGQARRVPSLAVAGKVKNIEERIKTMLRPGKKFYKRPSVIVLTIVLLLALLIVPIGCVLTNREKAKTAANQEKRYASLYEAAWAGSLSEVKRLIAEGANVNDNTTRNETPLHAAAANGNKEITELLIVNGAEVDANKPGYTPLTWAMWQLDYDSKKDIVEVLVNHGADVNFKPFNDDPAIFYSVWNEDVQLAELLLAHGARLDAKSDNGWTVLRHAAAYGNQKLVEFFVSKGANAPEFHLAAFMGDLNRVKSFLEKGMEVDTKDEFDWTPLFWAASNAQQDVVEYLIDKGADINVRVDGNRTLLHQAAQSGELNLVKLLISKGLDINAKDRAGMTPLHHAARNGHKDVAELLIKNGANLNVKNRTGRTPLHLACQLGYKEIIELLLDNGADVNSKNNGGGTALHRAAGWCQKDIVETLIVRGADVNARSRNSMTPLHIAAREGRKNIVELFISKGADVNVINNAGVTLLDLTEQRGHSEVVELLLKHGAKRGFSSLLGAVPSGDIEQVKSLISQGADVNAKNNAGQSLLHLTCQRGNKEIAELLIDNGADIEAKNRKHQTPLHVACQRGNKEIVELLIENNANIGHTPDERYGSTALHIAAVYGHKDIIEYLIEKGADAEAKNSDGGSPLGLIAGYGTIYNSNPQLHNEIIELFIDKGADIETRSYWDCTPLYVAILVNRHDVAELLLNRGAKIDVINKFWGTIAHGAMRENLPEFVSWSIEKGVDIPLLHQAAYFGDIDKVKSLISDGGDVNLKDIAEFTALHCATLGQNKEIAQLLIDNGANIEARNCGNRTPLYDLCHTGYLGMVKLLIENGANVNTTGNHRDEFSSDGIADDWTPLHVAAHVGRAEVAEYLLTKGADIQAKCTRLGHEGLTALHLGARHGRLNVVEVLLANEADINAKTDKGSTPLSLAQEQAQYLPPSEAQNYNAIVQFLHEHEAKE